MDAGEQEFLQELEVEVDADIAMHDAATPPADESPDEWFEDPYEAAIESADLQGLRGAIEVLEGGPDVSST